VFGRLRDFGRSVGTMWPRLLRSSARAAAAVTAFVDLDDVFVFGGCVLLYYGMAEAWRPGRFLAPALVLLWVYVPQRVPFIARTAEKRRVD
jgi:hypothetical protein